MVVQSIIKLAIILAIALVLILFLDKQWALLILSLTYPITIIAKEVRFLYSIKVLDVIECDFFCVFSRAEDQLAIQDKAQLLSAIIRYEVVMASLGKELSTKVYKKLNDKLTKEWTEMCNAKFKKQ